MGSVVLGEKAHHKQKGDPCGISEDLFQEAAGGDRRGQRSNKLRRLFEYLSDLKEVGFTGYIKINYSQGHIGRVEKFEEILKE